MLHRNKKLFMPRLHACQAHVEPDPQTGFAKRLALSEDVTNSAPRVAESLRTKMPTPTDWKLMLRSRPFAVNFLIIISLLASFTAQPAEAKAAHKKPHGKHLAKRHHGLPVGGEAKYANIVIDAHTGRILHANNPDGQRHPASLTKMMTLYLAFQALDAGKLQLDRRLAVSENASEQSPSKLGLRPGQSIRVEDAILGLVTESANDAAVVLGEAMGGSEAHFAQMMTRQAQALGMKQTVFYNPSGLPNPDQYTSARDMAVLGYALINHYPQYYPYFDHDSFTYAGINHHNHNHLKERYAGMDGIKTGYVRASGFNLVASAVHGNTRLIGVVFGGKSPLARDNQMAQLLDQSFAIANNPKIAVTKASSDTVTDAQGDTADTADSNYIALPAKIAAIYPVTPQPAQRARRGADTGTATTDTDTATSLPANTVATNWGIQVGAYGDPAVGKQAMAGMVQTLPQLLSRADQSLQKVTGADGNAIYRARFMGMEQNNARSICTYMVKHNQSCLVVAPEQVDN